MILILNKKANTLNTRGERPADFVLKVVGQDEYLIGEYPLIQFSYVQETLSRGDANPTLVTVAAANVPGKLRKILLFLLKNYYMRKCIAKFVKVIFV